MKIVIDNKAFELKFGFKCFMNLGEELGLETFNQVIQKLGSFSENENDISFEQFKLIEKLVIAAAEAHPAYHTLDYSIYDVVVIDAVMEQPGLLQKIMTAFSASIPKGEAEPEKKIRKTSKPKNK